MDRNQLIDGPINCRTSEVSLEASGLLRVVFKQNVVHSYEDAVELVAVIRQLTHGDSALILVDARGLASISREARKYHATESKNDTYPIAATALLVKSAVTRMMAQMYVRLNHPHEHTRIFAKESFALKWLSHMHPFSVEKDPKPQLLNQMVTLNLAEAKDVTNDFDDVIDILTEYSQQNFSRRIEAGKGGPSKLALAAAVNMLGEELQSSTLSYERFTRIINSAPAVFYTSSCDGENAMTFVGSNAEIFGYTSDDFINDPGFWRQHIHEDDKDEVLRRLRQLMDSGKIQCTYRFRKSDGEYVWIRHNGLVLRDESGNPLEIVGFMADADEEIKAGTTAQMLTDILEQTSIVVVTDQAGTIMSCNDNFCAISGYPRSELVGQNHRILQSGYHDKMFFRKMWNEIAHGRIWRGEIKNRRKDGTFYWVDTTIAPMTDRRKKICGYIAIRFDITTRKLTEQMLAESAKLASLGEMAGGIAHEINNPVAIIDGSAERVLKLLKKDHVDIDVITEFVQTIKDTSQRIAKIVSGLRTLSRSADDDPYQLVDVGKLIDEVLVLCRERLVRHGIEVDVRLRVDGTQILGNRTQLSQILLNLVGNADDAMKDDDKKWLRIDAEDTGDWIELSVTNSGAPILPKVRAKLFTPYFTTKVMGKGTGLGLSISRKLAEQHQGSLIYDDLSPHTRFVLKLPKQKF